MPDGFDGLVWGRFRLGDLLGSGGTSSVFEALDVQTGRDVALKVLHPHLAADPAGRHAFLAEADLMASAVGPNVVHVLESGSGDSFAWIAMERVPGLTLSEVVADRGALSVSAALSIAEGVLRGLMTTHAAGLAHRDVSPGNVMVDVGDGVVDPSRVRLIDFGIAARDGRVVDGEVQGNPNYASPEQARGAPADARGDLYQAGGVLYFALTGQPPFVRDTVAAMLEAHRSSPPPVPSVRVRGLPREVDRLVARALVKHPDGRFPTAAAMLEAVTDARARLQPLGQAEVAEAATTVLGTASPVSADGRTQVLGTVPPARAPKRRSPARHIRPPSGWLAAFLVTGLVASAWILAAQGSPAPAPQASAPATAPPAEVTAPPSARSQPVVLRVPSVEGTTLDAARAALERSGFTVGELIIQDSALAGDTVLKVSPAAGSAMPVGSVVELVVASGSNGVPAVVGMTQADATAAVEAAGLVARVLVSESETAGPGTVIACTPDQRTTVRLGSEVELVIAAPKPAAPSPSPSPTPSPTPYPETLPEAGVRAGSVPST